jgi:hypothetical protein
MEPVRHQPRPDPLALRGRLGASFARFLGGLAIPLYGLRSRAHSPELYEVYRLEPGSADDKEGNPIRL